MFIRFVAGGVRRPLAVLVAIVALGLVFGSPGMVSIGAQAQNQTGSPLPPAGNIIVVMKEGVLAAAADNVSVEVGVKQKHEFDTVFNGFSTTANQTQIAKLAADPRVDFIAPDLPIQAAAQTPSSAISRSAIAGFAQIDGGGGDANIGIAILDSGVQNGHPDLNYAGGFNCSSAPSDQPYQGTSDDHGTHVAGIAAARDNTIGVVGSAPGARIYNYRVLDSESVGLSSWMICALEEAIANPDVKVINMSVAGVSGFGTSNCAGPDPLHMAVCDATDAGKLIVVAAGNYGDDAGAYFPARYPEVVAVGNISDGSPVGAPGGDSYYSNSNFGSVVDIAAPGTNILSTVPGSSYGTMTGTSMSSPLVAGAAAYYIAQSGASAATARTWLLNTASVPMSTPNGCSCSAPTGSPNRMLYLGGLVTTYPPGTANPTFSGTKAPIVNSASTPSVAEAPPTYSYDNNLFTNWHSGHSTPSTASLRFDLGSSKVITGVKWRFYALGYADSFTVKLFNSSGGEIASYGPFGNGDSGSTWYGQSVPSTSAQYVRFYFANPNGDSALGSIAEVEIWSSSPLPPGTTNPTFSGVDTPIVNAASTPSVAEAPPAYAYDASLATNWHTGHSTPTTASLRFDLGANKSLTGVKWRFAYTGYADSFTVKLVNASGVEVGSYGPFGNGTSTTNYFGFSVGGTNARYVRFYFDNPNGDSALGSISDLEIWSAVAGETGVQNPSFTGQRLTLTNAASTPSVVSAFNAYDLNTSTVWHSGSSTPATASLRFDLGAAQTITGVKWKFSSLGSADSFRVVLADASGTVEQDLGTFTNGTLTNTFFGKANATTFQARFVRFYFNNPNNDAVLGNISEIEIFGPGSGGQGVDDPGELNPAFSGSELDIVNSASTPNIVQAPPGYAHDGSYYTNWHSGHSYPATASLRFDLGADTSVSGVRWRFYGLGYADSFTVKIVNASGQEVGSYGPFGNGTSGSAWYGLSLDGTDARFVRFYFDNPNGDSALGSIAEVEIWGEPSAPLAAETEFAGMSLPIADSDASSGDPAAAHDGDEQTTFAASAEAPTTLRFDLGGERELTGLRWQSAADTLVTLRLSGDGATWTEVGTFANQPDGSIWQGTALPAGSRARFVEVDLGAGASLGEFEVWGLVALPAASPAASPEASPGAATPEPVVTETPADASPAPVQPTAEPTQTPTESEASPAPATEEPTATETVEPTSTATTEPTSTETLEPSATATETVEPTATSTSELTVEPTAAISFGTITGTDGDAVNCRVAPIDGDPITQLTEGDEVEVTGEAEDGWLPVLCDGQPGWIAELFVTLGTVDPTEEGAEPTEEAGVTATATTDGEATAEPTEAVTEEPTAEPTEEVVEEPYPIVDTGDTEDSGTAWLASDDDPRTWWSVYPSQSPEQARLYLDLGSVVPIDRIEIELAQEGLLPYFELWLSEDGETWYNATPNGINGWNLWAGEPHVFQLGYDARYVRLVIPNVDESGLSEVGGIAEIAVWPGDITQTQYLTALGEPTTPTPEPVEEVPTAEPTEEVVEEPTEEEVVEPTEEVVGEPTEEIPVEEPTEEEAAG
jgi:subtilisin family serine protease/outer membrane biosynthesis protein TonB